MSENQGVLSRVITIGIIRKPVGLAGVCAVQVFGNSLEQLSVPVQVYVGMSEQMCRAISIKSIAFRSKGLACRFVGIDSIEQAETLRNNNIYISADLLPELENGSYYHFDLVGLKVQSDCGKEIGTVIAVHNFPSVDCVEVKRSGSDTLMIPLTADAVVAVDKETGYLTVRSSFLEELM